jgi:hypothetical protein
MAPCSSYSQRQVPSYCSRIRLRKSADKWIFWKVQLGDGAGTARLQYAARALDEDVPDIRGGRGDCVDAGDAGADGEVDSRTAGVDLAGTAAAKAAAMHFAAGKKIVLVQDNLSRAALRSAAP